MSLFYSASVGGFFDSDIHATLPGDAVPITAEEHAALLAGQREGKIIQADDRGRPVARAPKVPTDMLRAHLVDLVKREAAHRIGRVAPMWRQLNDARDLPQATGAAREAIEARHAAIDAIRAASDLIEQQIASLGARALASFDPSTSDHWPKEP